MSTTPNNVSDNQEIDLSQISKKIGEGFQNIGVLIFKIILFIQRNIIFIFILIVLGILLGYFSSGSKKHFESRIIVTPNYGSTNYLYSQIEFVNSNIRNKNLKFLNSIGLSDDVQNLKIEAIVDVYRLANDSEKNYELLKLMSEESEFSKILKSETTSRNFKQHEIVINSSGLLTKKQLKLFLNFLNSNEYYLKLRKEVLENINIKIKSNDYMIDQIDNILNNYSKGNLSNNLVYNENSDFNELIKFKNELLVEYGNRKIELLNYNNIIKENSTILNISRKESALSNKMVQFPILFLFIFIFIKIFVPYYKNQKELIK